MKPWLLTINDANRSTLWVGVFRTSDLTRHALCFILEAEADKESEVTRIAAIDAAEQIARNSKFDAFGSKHDECVKVAGQTVGYITFERIFAKL